MFQIFAALLSLQQLYSPSVLLIVGNVGVFMGAMLEKQAFYVWEEFLGGDS